MALNYAEKWSPDLLKINIQNSITSPFITNEFNFTGVKKIHFTGMTTSGLKDHSRQGGWNRGTYNQFDKEYEVKQERDIEFFIDKLDVNETNKTASIKNIAMVNERTQVVPEYDSYFFGTVAKAAKDAGLSSETALSSYTKANVYEKLKAFISNVKKYRSVEVMYVRSKIMDLLEQSTAFTRSIEVTTIAEGGAGIETRITSLDGVTLIENLNDDVFYDAFVKDDENGGLKPATGAHPINIILCNLETVKRVNWTDDIYYFEPGQHTEGNGYLYQRALSYDTFVLPNGLDGNVDSVYVDVDTDGVVA